MSDKVDLKLIPIEELLDEIKDRTEYFCYIYTRAIDGGAPIIAYNWHGPSYIFASGLCDELKIRIQDHGRKHNIPDENAI